MKDIKGYEGRYAVTKSGEIFSYYLNDFLSPKNEKDGYLMVCLQKKGVKKYFQVHRLVAITYIENTEDLPAVNHKDGYKKNNDYENLEWMTISGNIKHAHSIGLRCHRGSKNQNSKLTEKEVKEIRMLSNTKTPREISNIYGVVPGTIYNIINDISWKHVI